MCPTYQSPKGKSFAVFSFVRQQSALDAALVGSGVRIARPGNQATLHFFWLCVAFFGAFTFSFNGPFDPLDWTFYWGDVVAMLMLPRELGGIACVMAATAGAVACIDLAAISKNVANLSGRLEGGAEMCAVVKANAYGHGLVDAYAATTSSSLLSANQGVAPSTGLGLLALDRGSIDVWARAAGEPREEPIPLQKFLRYADWFRQTFVPDVDDGACRGGDCAGPCSSRAVTSAITCSVASARFHPMPRRDSAQRHSGPCGSSRDREYTVR